MDYGSKSDNEKLMEDEIRSLRLSLDKELSAHSATRRQLEKVTLAYSRFLPPQLLSILEKGNIVDLELGTQIEREMTILFSDIRDFTSISERMTPQQNFAFINDYLYHMEPIIFKNNGVIDKYIGDAIMAIFPKSASDAVKAAIAMLAKLDDFNESLKHEGISHVRIGIGLNTGISMLGTVGGTNKMEGTVISDAVNLASRLESLTKIYGAPLLISEHTLYSLSNASEQFIRFIDRVLVKGKSRPQCIFEVYDADPIEIRLAKMETLRLFEEALAYYHYKNIDKAEELLVECLKKNPSDQPARVYLERCQNYQRTGHHESTGELEMITTWKDEYNVGISAIDHQHMELLDQINRLSAAINHGSKDEEISEAIAFVENYVRVHFNTEESLMARHNYPFITEHKKQHQVFYQYFLKLKQEMEGVSENKLFLSFRTQVFLVDWLINHSTKTDKHLGKYLKERTQISTKT